MTYGSHWPSASPAGKLRACATSTDTRAVRNDTTGTEGPHHAEEEEEAKEEEEEEGAGRDGT